MMRISIATALIVKNNFRHSQVCGSVTVLKACSSIFPYSAAAVIVSIGVKEALIINCFCCLFCSGVGGRAGSEA